MFWLEVFSGVFGEEVLALAEGGGGVVPREQGGTYSFGSFREVHPQ